MSLEPMDFLSTLAGVARAGVPDRSAKIATIDPAYVASSYPGTLPRVTFDGETVLSTRRYASLYAPTPNDRVVMLPVGTTYVILGKIGGV